MVLVLRLIGFQCGNYEHLHRDVPTEDLVREQGWFGAVAFPRDLMQKVVRGNAMVGGHDLSSICCRYVNKERVMSAKVVGN